MLLFSSFYFSTVTENGTRPVIRSRTSPSVPTGWSVNVRGIGCVTSVCRNEVVMCLRGVTRELVVKVGVERGENDGCVSDLRS